MSEKDGILLAIECVNRHNHGFIKCHPMFIRGHNEAVKAITKELQSLIETAPIGGDYFEGFSEGIKVGRNEMIESARAELAAVTAERDRMRTLLTRLYDAAGPLDADKMPADDFAQIITIVLDARAALEGVTKKEGEGNGDAN